MRLLAAICSPSRPNTKSIVEGLSCFRLRLHTGHQRRLASPLISIQGAHLWPFSKVIQDIWYGYQAKTFAVCYKPLLWEARKFLWGDPRRVQGPQMDNSFKPAIDCAQVIRYQQQPHNNQQGTSPHVHPTHNALGRGEPGNERPNGESHGHKGDRQSQGV
jgi:hypothetical protein